MALQSMQPNAGILAAHHGCHASDLTYDIVLRRVPWISRSISQPVNGAAAGTNFTVVDYVALVSLKACFSTSFDTICGQLELREEADVFCRALDCGMAKAIWTFDICSLFVSASIDIVEGL
jgi:hypothetical protein